MKAIVLDQFGGVENLKIANVNTPVAQPGEVLVQVKAISINPVDVKTRAGGGLSNWLKDHKRLILGWDISGVVERVGEGVSQFKEGDAVFGMVNFPGLGAAYAEYVAAPANQLALKPANISHEEAAAATLAALTAYQFMYHIHPVKPGERVLVHAAAGGVGHFAVQLAKLAGAYVIGTASTANFDFVRSLGADEIIDYRAQPFEDVVSDIDFVFDAVGGELVERSLAVLKPGGTIISIAGALPDGVAEKAAGKSIDCSFQLVKSDGADMEILAALLAQGKLLAHVSQVFPFTEMGAAHLQIESGRTRGKLAITV